MYRNLLVPIGFALLLFLHHSVTPSFAQSESSPASAMLAPRAAHRAQAVSPNLIPFLAQPSDMSVTEGSVAEQSVTATDDDGQSLRFFKLGGPEFLSIATTSSQAAGSAVGQIRLLPGYIDAGLAKGTIGVSDGIDGARRTFSVTVGDAGRSPSSAWAYMDSTAFSTTEDPTLTAMADLNGDGINDLIVGHTNTGVVSVFIGGGGTAFQWKADFASGGRSLSSLSLGDFTGDSRPDLATTDADRVWLMAGLGDGTFGAPVPVSAGTQPYSSHAGDLNGDGVSDLVVGNYNAGTVSVLLGDGRGRFGARVAYSAGPTPIKLDLVDLNLDGHLDIAVADYGSQVSILLGDGAGSFAGAQHYPHAAQPGEPGGGRCKRGSAARHRDSRVWPRFRGRVDRHRWRAL